MISDEDDAVERLRALMIAVIGGDRCESAVKEVKTGTGLA